MLIATIDFIPNMEIVEAKESVFSEEVIAVNAAKDIINGMKGIFGGKIESYSKEYKEARILALKELGEQAETMDGNAVINVRVNYNQFINSDTLFIVATASGLVVTAKNITE